MIKSSVYQQTIAILNLYSLNKRDAKYMKQKLIELKDEIDKFVILFGETSAPLWTSDRTTRQKMSKDIEELKNSINQRVSDIYRALNNSRTHILFKCPWNTYQNRSYPTS